MTCGGAGPAGNDAPSDATRFRGRAAVTGGRFDGATGWLRAGASFGISLQLRKIANAHDGSMVLAYIC